MAEQQEKWANLVFHSSCNDDGAISYAATKDIWAAPVETVVKYVLQRDSFVLNSYQDTESKTTFSFMRLPIPQSAVRSFEDSFGPDDVITLKVDIDDLRSVFSVRIDSADKPYFIKPISGNNFLFINTPIDTNPKIVEINYASVIDLSANTLSFTFENGQNPAAQTLALSNTGGGEMNWSVTADLPTWLSVSPANGVGNTATLTVAVDGAGLAPGVYQKDITVTAVGANTPRIAPVPLTVVDTTPPTVTATLPAANAANVDPETVVTATFSEAIDPATLTPSTFGLQWVSSTTVTYDPTTRTATLKPSSPLAAATTYTATVKGGVAGVRDLAGNALSTDIAWSFTTASIPTYSVWNSSATPANPSQADSSSVELGVKFKTDVSGFITGLRFYKGIGNTGTHLGTLWSSSGQKLATATFTNETAAGWQQVNFANPVAITANMVYVASYHAPNGHYAVDRPYFATAGVDAPPVHLLRDGVSGGNGVYKYSNSAPVFPASTYKSSNYWVDVVFTLTPLRPLP
jgi:hypothetical protein